MRHRLSVSVILPILACTAPAASAQSAALAAPQLAVPTDAAAPRPAAGTLADGGLLCVSDPSVRDRLREVPILIDPVTGDTFATVGKVNLPLEMAFPASRNYVRSRPWFAGPGMEFLGGSFAKVGDPAPEPFQAMRPVGTVGDVWLFRKNGTDPRNDLYAITGAGCEFQHYRSTAPPVAGMRASRLLLPRHRSIRFATNRNATADIRPARHFGIMQAQLSQGTAGLVIPAVHALGRLEAKGFLGRPDTLRHLILLNLDVPSAPSASRKALVFIHGYDNSFEDAARRAAQLADDLDFDGDVFFFSWPSRGSLAGYGADETTVKLSRPEFRAMLDAVLEAYGTGNVSVIVHSLGNRGFAQAVRDLQPSRSGKIFNDVVLAAPDQDLDVFRNEDVMPILAAANRVTVYASPLDLALFASRALHGGSRAGDDPAALADIPGLEVVDTSPESSSIVGHTDYAESPAVLGDLFLLLRGRTPQQRHLVEVDTGHGIFWRVP